MTGLQRRSVVLFVALWTCALFFLSYRFMYRFTGYVHPFVFWASFLWLLGLMLLALYVTVKRLSAPPPAKLRLKTGFILRPGAAIFTWIFVLANGALLINALLGERDAMLVRGYPMLQMLLLAFYIIMMGWLFLEYYIGLPANAGIKAAQNIRRLDEYLDQILFYTVSDWLGNARGVTTRGRLRAALNWWHEVLSSAMPGRSIAMALPAVTQYLENLNREITSVDALYEAREQGSRSLEDAEKRVLDYINRAERVAERLQS